MSKYNVVVRLGASSNSIQTAGGTYHMDHMDVEQRKANERAGRAALHEYAEQMFGKQGSKRHQQRRQRKGYAHA